MKKILTVLLIALVLTGCGSESENKNEMPPAEQNTPVQETTEQKETTGTNEPKGYVFVYNDVKIGMDMEAAPIIAALGEPAGYFEAPSCAFEGLDKTYSYGSFEIDTYEQDGKDYISCVFLCDDLIETTEGVALFETKADMISAYGDAYAEEFGMLVYTKDDMKLKFILDGDEITSIEYSSTALDVE